MFALMAGAIQCRPGRIADSGHEVRGEAVHGQARTDGLQRALNYFVIHTRGSAQAQAQSQSCLLFLSSFPLKTT